MVVFVAAVQVAAFGAAAKSSSSCGLPVMSTAALKVTPTRIVSPLMLKPLWELEVISTPVTVGALPKALVTVWSVKESASLNARSSTVPGSSPVVGSA